VHIDWSKTTHAWSGSAQEPSVPTLQVQIADLTIRPTPGSTPDSKTGQLVATRPDGSIAWKSRKYTSRVMALWADEKRVYAAWRGPRAFPWDDESWARNNRLVAMNASTGEELWQIGMFDFSSVLESNLILAADSVILTEDDGVTDEGIVVVIEAATGVARWRYDKHASPEDGPSPCRSALAETVVRLTCDGPSGTVYAALDLVTGNQVGG
jgi:outer membrane protein assembly factor BamB